VRSQRRYKALFGLLKDIAAAGPLDAPARLH
jgi:hypothetical protein